MPKSFLGVIIHQLSTKTDIKYVILEAVLNQQRCTLDFLEARLFFCFSI